MITRPSRRALAAPLALTAVVAGTLGLTASGSDARADDHAPATALPAQSARLVDRQVLPAATFGEPVPSGAGIETANGVAVPFAAQPVQGSPRTSSSRTVPTSCCRTTATDEGHSADFLLAVHRLTDPGTGTLQVAPGGFTLSDPYGEVTWP